MDHLGLSAERLMETRGIMYKMLLDSKQHRTPDEIERLSYFLEWLYMLQEAHADGQETITIHLYD